MNNSVRLSRSKPKFTRSKLTRWLGTENNNTIAINQGPTRIAAAASSQKEHGGLGKEVARQTLPAGTGSQPDGHLESPAPGAREKKIGDVGAGDKEHGAHDRNQDDACEPDFGLLISANRSPVVWAQAQDSIFPAGIFECQLGDNGGQTGLGTFQGHIGFETSDHAQPTVVGIVEPIRRPDLWLHHHRHPNVRTSPGESFETLWHDSCQREWMTVNLTVFPTTSRLR